MKKLPYGISDYEELKNEDYYYVDKTMYIEELEEFAASYIMFLRPRKFGKTLFTSMLENYYDIATQSKFEKLYADTYIGKNPTKLKNRYHILKFNFSEINTENKETTIKDFKKEVASSIQLFVQKYGLDFVINDDDEAEYILNRLFKTFYLQKPNEQIYVIIDDYDHFANELLELKTEQFQTLESKLRRIRQWYEILKEGTETVVDKIFITGVVPITLDGLTSGFNISLDITKDLRFNEMMGFTEEELIKLLEDENISKEEQEKILPIMKENYGGYTFSIDGKEKIYNSNMCLNFLTDYIKSGRIPEQLVDVNMASGYSKLENILELCQRENRQEIIEKTVLGKPIISEITEKFNPAIEFTEKDLISMLYYLGYLTIVGEDFEMPELAIPNKVMKEIYADYFIQAITKDTELEIKGQEYNTIAKEIALEGKIDRIIEMLTTYLNNLSNRDYMKFDEKYVKLIFYCIAMNLKMLRVKSEMEVQRKYPDILIMPRDKEKGYASVMIEFKYLKKDEADMLKQKQEEARKQIEEYANFEEIKNIEKLRKYTVVAVNDKVYVEEIK